MSAKENALRILNFSSAMALLFSVSQPLPALAVQATVISVDAFTNRGAISPYVNGANHRYINDGYGMFDSINGVVYQDFINKSAAAKIGAVRYPGGTVANRFKWKDSIGPVADRKNQVGFNFNFEKAKYGLDEHMAYAEAIGAKVIYMVGEAQETPESAADLVEYLNSPNNGSNPGGGTDWAAVRAANGHPAPYGVTHFEIGNEMYNGAQKYWMDFPSVPISGPNKTDVRKYSLGDTVLVLDTPVRRYGTWDKNDSNGTAAQKFYTQYAPVDADSQTIKVNGVVWTEVANLSASNSTAEVYQFDDATGEVLFGDGVNGKIPASGVGIRAASYKHTHAGFDQYYEAMKAIDPSIKIYACLEGVYTHLDKDKCDGYALHDYPHEGAGHPIEGYPLGTYGGQKFHDRTTTMSDVLVLALDDHRADIKNKSLRNDTIIPITEVGTFDAPDITSMAPGQQYLILSRGLMYATAMIGAINKEYEIYLHSNYTSDLFNAIGASGGWSLYAPDPNDTTKTIETPEGLAYNMVGNGIGNKVLNSFVAGNPKIVGTTTYPALRLLVTKNINTNEIYLLVVNRHAANDVATTIILNGFTISGNATIRTMNGSSVLAFNNPAHPNDVSISTTTQSLGTGASSFDYTFPAHSVVSIKLNGGAASNNWANEFPLRDFQSESIGVVPSYLAVSPAGNCTVQFDPANGSDKTFRMVRSASDRTATHSFTAITSNLVKISAKVKAAQKTSKFVMTVKGGAGVAAGLTFDVNGKIANNGMTRYVYSANAWNDIEIVLDQAAQRYTVYINGQFAVNRDYNDLTATDINSITFDVSGANGTFYIDDLKCQAN
jgi:alpha-L-arabinofuranosidase